MARAGRLIVGNWKMNGLGGDLAELKAIVAGIGSKIEPEVLGGVVVVLGDQLIDGSVRREIERLREELSTATVI